MTVEEARAHWRWAPYGCSQSNFMVTSLPGPGQRAVLEPMLERAALEQRRMFRAALHGSPLAAWHRANP